MIKEMLKEVNRIMKPFPVYAVGGCVRDYILGVEPKDYDFTTPANPFLIEQLIKSKSMRAFLTGKKFGTIGCKVKIDNKYYPIEITTFRTEKYEAGNRKPEVEFVKSITEDLSRRDFTINAMAMRLEKDGRLRIIDPFNGQDDLLKYRIIKCVGNPKTRFKEDPLRMLRAIRFSCRFNYEIEQMTMKKMMEGAIQILNISKERWMMEIDKILQSENVERGLMDLWQSNLFKFMIPELVLQNNYKQNSQYHNWDLDVHTIKVVEAIRKETDDLNMLWAGLLHDIAKPFVRTDKEILSDSHIGGYICDNCGSVNGPIACNVWICRCGKQRRNLITKSNYIRHEILGAEMVKRIAQHLKWSKERTNKVVDLVKHHLEDSCPLRKYDNEGKS